jgi:hypothetical protein
MKRFLRYLRIAFSAFCGIACVLLIVLWVRSATNVDALQGPLSKEGFWHCQTIEGHIVLYLVKGTREDKLGEWNAGTISLEAVKAGMEGAILGKGNLSWEWPAAHDIASVPCWVPTVCVFALGIVPWLPWHFSLRTLLIAMTLIAVVLGLIVWTLRR